MKYSALIGNPTDHSVSYLLYDQLARAAGVPEFYQHIRVNVLPEGLKQSINAFNELNFIGLNVTLPYKLDVIEHLDNIDPVVNDLGAVNTIKLGDTTTGYNTDWIGIAESVRQFGNRSEIKSTSIFGTGGAARAAIYACKQLAVQEINVLYRTEESEGTRKLQSDAAKLGIKLHPYSNVRGLIDDADLIINATSAGMIGKDPTPFDLEILNGLQLEGKIFLDAVFKPLTTPLMDYFRSNGATTIDGLWMMIYQGVGAMSIWFDRKVQADMSELQQIHNLLEKELQNV